MSTSEAIDVAETLRRSTCRSGLPIALTLHGGIMPCNPVGWFEIYVQNMPRAKAFYESAFAAPLQKPENPDPPIRAARPAKEIP